MTDLKFAAQEKQTPEHDVIDEAIQEGAEVGICSPNHHHLRREPTNRDQEFTVFSIGVGIVYRPNNAKVKNLKLKDYLGKARLIATADHSHVTGSDAKKAALQAAAGRSPDDRLPESISFAASNLVRPNLHSRSRQQSEPPVHRNVFPPTPPPENENDKIRSPLSTASTSPPANPTSPSSLRLQSTQPPPNHPLRPEPLKLSTSSFTSLEQREAPRIGTMRTASEPRGPSYRDPARQDRHSREPSRLFMETTPLRPNSGLEADIDEDLEEEEHHDHPAHRRTQSSYHPTTDAPSRPRRPSSRNRHSARSRSRGPRRTHYSIEEEDETGGTASTGSSLDDYEILHNAGGELSLSPPATVPQATYTAVRARAQSERPGYHRARSSSRHAGRATSSHRRPPPPPPELKNIRIKCHYGDDTRFIMQAADVAFDAFVAKVKEKFKLPRDQAFKVKVRDEDADLITMGDADDWSMAIAAVRKDLIDEVLAAEAENGPALQEAGPDGLMGKMEVWVT